MPTSRTIRFRSMPIQPIAEALLSGASAQLRNAATVGGNLLQRTRCAYFYDVASACNRREPGSGCDARDGENRLHAVLGWSEACIATHPSDFCVPLVALDAVVEIEGQERPARGRAGEPASPARRDAGAGKRAGARRSDRGAALAGRSARFRAHARYLKVRERTSYAFAVVSAAAALRIEDGEITEARIALGGVAAKPWRARAAEEALAGAAADCRGLPSRGARWRSPMPSRPATTLSRSNWRSGSSCAP